ncbi:hypothetical protein [Thiobacillus sp.]|uniref:hypothetical protein n=1 Tax=Thiobacillus sp. TaxID=924 RepID=UPI0025F1FDCB|nr:hypothetical protein [Thiobacillus sp.]MBT9540300.1 hypothetical protein [Thiobacillus sp.]
MNAQIKNAVGIVVPYSFMCAFLSLYYFWKPFGIQPFEFISISEAVAYGIPFLMLSSFMLFPVFIGELLWPSNYPEETQNDAKKSYLEVHVILVIFLNLAMIVLAEFDHWSSRNPLFMGLVAGIFPAAFRLGSLNEFAQYFPSKNIRVFVFLIICCLPAASVSSAVWNRSEIINKSDFHTVSGKDIKSEVETGNLTYLGHLGEYVFLLKENSTVAYRLDDLKKLELRKGSATQQRLSSKTNDSSAQHAATKP